MTHQVLHVHVLRVLRRARVGGEPWAAGARGWKPSPVAFVGPRVPRRATGLCTTSPPISARIRMTACGTGPSSSLSRRERGQHKCFWDRFLELNLAPMPLPPVPGCSEDRQLPRLLQASPRSYTSISLDCALTTRVRSTCIAILGFENSRQSAEQVHKGNCMAPRLQLGYENFQMAPLL